MQETNRRPSKGVLKRHAFFCGGSASLLVLSDNLDWREYRAARELISRADKVGQVFNDNRIALLVGDEA